jgi:hypothetical protein
MGRPSGLREWIEEFAATEVAAIVGESRRRSLSTEYSANGSFFRIHKTHAVFLSGG